MQLCRMQSEKVPRASRFAASGEASEPELPRDDAGGGMRSVFLEPTLKANAAESGAAMARYSEFREK